MPTLGFNHLKFCICYINELVQELLDNTSIFYYDTQLGVNVITLEPLLTGNKQFNHFLFSSIYMYVYIYIYIYIPFLIFPNFALPIFFHFGGQIGLNIMI